MGVFVSYKGTLWGIARWQWLSVLLYTLIAGVVCALVAANQAPEWYGYWFGTHGAPHPVWEVPGHLTIFGHHLTLHFLINDIFMVFFFGIAAIAVEIFGYIEISISVEIFVCKV